MTKARGTSTRAPQHDILAAPRAPPPPRVDARPRLRGRGPGRGRAADRSLRAAAQERSTPLADARHRDHRRGSGARRVALGRVPHGAGDRRADLGAAVGHRVGGRGPRDARLHHVRHRAAPARGSWIARATGRSVQRTLGVVARSVRRGAREPRRAGRFCRGQRDPCRGPRIFGGGGARESASTPGSVASHSPRSSRTSTCPSARRCPSQPRCFAACSSDERARRRARGQAAAPFLDHVRRDLHQPGRQLRHSSLRHLPHGATWVLTDARGLRVLAVGLRLAVLGPARRPARRSHRSTQDAAARLLVGSDGDAHSPARDEPARPGAGRVPPRPGR